MIKHTNLRQPHEQLQHLRIVRRAQPGHRRNASVRQLNGHTRDKLRRRDSIRKGMFKHLRDVILRFPISGHRRRKKNHRIPALNRAEANGTAAGIATVGDVVEHPRILVERRICLSLLAMNTCRVKQGGKMAEARLQPCTRSVSVRSTMRDRSCSNHVRPATPGQHACTEQNKHVCTRSGTH